MKFTATAICLFALAVGCSSKIKTERFGMSGVVTIDGKPADRMIVQLTHLDPQTSEQDRYASSKTNAAGEFVFGDLTDGAPSGFKGAVAGEYAVTFSWLSTDDFDAVDKLNGKFADAASSEFRVTLPRSSAAELLKFEIKTKR